MKYCPAFVFILSAVSLLSGSRACQEQSDGVADIMESTTGLLSADEDCIMSNGRCQDDSLRCNGSYLTGRCAGAKTRRCCTEYPIVKDTGFCSNIDIISRDSWGARRPKEVENMTLPVNYVLIHHTVTQGCSDTDRCMFVLKNIQELHMQQRGFSDIGYNFLVGGDGNIYEGRGWDRIGAHTLGYNDNSIAISFIGSFMLDNPPPSVLNASRALLKCATELSVLTQRYSLLGHRDVKKTLCPGDVLYRTIEEWPHYGGTQ
ncbi:hypothetical protein ScPMuIL_006665 [Solemya velum]